MKNIKTKRIYRKIVSLVFSELSKEDINGFYGYKIIKLLDNYIDKGIERLSKRELRLLIKDNSIKGYPYTKVADKTKYQVYSSLFKRGRTGKYYIIDNQSYYDNTLDCIFDSRKSNLSKFFLVKIAKRVHELYHNQNSYKSMFYLMDLIIIF